MKWPRSSPFAPSEFEIRPSKLHWVSPCYIGADLSVIARTPAAKEKFFLPLSMPHQIDAFVRVPWKDQLWKTFSQRMVCMTGPHSNAWFSELLDCFEKLKAGLHRTETIFAAGF